MVEQEKEFEPSLFLCQVQENDLKRKKNNIMKISPGHEPKVRYSEFFFFEKISEPWPQIS